MRQRPGTASGVVFVTLEDEYGIANLVVWPKVFEAHRRIVMGSRLLGVAAASVQREGLVIHLVAEQLWDWSADLDRIAELDEDFRAAPTAAATRSAPIRAIEPSRARSRSNATAIASRKAAPRATTAAASIFDRPKIKIASRDFH